MTIAARVNDADCHISDQVIGHMHQPPTLQTVAAAQKGGWHASESLLSVGPRIAPWTPKISRHIHNLTHQGCML